MLGKYRSGDAVRVRETHPPGHCRTPSYARGRRGVIERVLDRFPNPEERAYGRDGAPGEVLYRVRFRQRDLWSDYCCAGGDAGDTVDVEIYEHWLAKAQEDAGR